MSLQRPILKGGHTFSPQDMNRKFEFFFIFVEKLGPFSSCIIHSLVRGPRDSSFIQLISKPRYCHQISQNYGNLEIRGNPKDIVTLRSPVFGRSRFSSFSDIFLFRAFLDDGGPTAWQPSKPTQRLLLLELGATWSTSADGDRAPGSLILQFACCSVANPKPLLFRQAWR